MLLTKRLSQNIASNIERIWVNQLISISSDIHEKNRGVLKHGHEVVVIEKFIFANFFDVLYYCIYLCSFGIVDIR